MREKYKFVHFFLHESLGFNLKLIDMFSNPQNRFNINQHLFITSYKPLYDLVKKEYTCDVIIDYKDKRNNVGLINKYGDMGEWLFVHSFPGEVDDFILSIRKKYLSKILWRTWGHDIGINKNVNNCIRSRIVTSIKKVYRYLMGSQRRIKMIYAVGIASVVDEINIRNNYDVNRIYVMAYPAKGMYESLMRSKEEHFEDGMAHIMIGHSGWSTDNHCNAVDKLKHFENRNVMIHLILSYGDPVYVESVKKYVGKNWKGKVEYLEKAVDYETYVTYVSKMDAVIFNCISSCGMGNLAIFLHLRKKLFVNEEGILHKGLCAEGIRFHLVDELTTMTYEELVCKETYEVPETSTLIIQPYFKYVELWKDLYYELECNLNSYSEK